MGLIVAATAHFMQKPIRWSCSPPPPPPPPSFYGFYSAPTHRVLLIYCVGRDRIGLSNRLDERVKESHNRFIYMK